MVEDELRVADEGCHAVLEDQVQEFGVVPAPLFDYFQIHTQVLRVDGVEPDAGFGSVR